MSEVACTDTQTQTQTQTHTHTHTQVGPKPKLNPRGGATKQEEQKLLHASPQAVG